MGRTFLTFPCDQTGEQDRILLYWLLVFAPLCWLVPHTRLRLQDHALPRMPCRATPHGFSLAAATPHARLRCAYARTHLTRIPFCTHA